MLCAISTARFTSFGGRCARRPNMPCSTTEGCPKHGFDSGRAAALTSAYFCSLQRHSGLRLSLDPGNPAKEARSSLRDQRDRKPFQPPRKSEARCAPHPGPAAPPRAENPRFRIRRSARLKEVFRTTPRSDAPTSALKTHQRVQRVGSSARKRVSGLEEKFREP